jgi:hypothetical protein
MRLVAFFRPAFQPLLLLMARQGSQPSWPFAQNFFVGLKLDSEYFCSRGLPLAIRDLFGGCLLSLIAKFGLSDLR